jgi:hypothetical protein
MVNMGVDVVIISDENNDEPVITESEIIETFENKDIEEEVK